MLLNTMFGLSARFSTDTTFVNQSPSERGNLFIQRAMLVYDEVRKDIENGFSSLRHLQGLILLAFNILLTSPSAQGWAISGYCFRLTFDLDLQDTDIDLVRDDADQSNITLKIGSTGKRDAALRGCAGTWMASCLRCLCNRLVWTGTVCMSCCLFVRVVLAGQKLSQHRLPRTHPWRGRVSKKARTKMRGLGSYW
jgi:hypothetical protein